MGRIFGQKDIPKNVSNPIQRENWSQKWKKIYLSLNVRMVIFIKLARLSHLLSFPSLFETFIFFARFFETFIFFVRN